jgi:hypothetical protein
MQKQIYFPGIVGYWDILEDPMQCVRAVDAAHEENKDIPFWHPVRTNKAGNANPEIMPDVRSGWNSRMDPGLSSHASEAYSNFGKISETLNRMVLDPINDYKSMYGMDLRFNEGWAILKYEPGDFFNAHTDASHEYPRQLSQVFYFNDNYEGGELEFPFLPLKVKPRAGEVLLFPSTYLFAHSANKVISGTKYSAISFSN